VVLLCLFMGYVCVVWFVCAICFVIFLGWYFGCIRVCGVSVFVYLCVECMCVPCVCVCVCVFAHVIK